MEETKFDLAASLKSLRLGEARHFGHLTVFSLFTGQECGPQYLTLGEALDAGLIEVGEISEGGSVPELSVLHKGDGYVLLLDGEELAGARQNRILNTSILVGPQGKVVIPVSCTEQRRWGYTGGSKLFSSAQNIMPSKLRSKKARSVRASLSSREAHHSDQVEVWEDIKLMKADLKVDAPTDAMKDVYANVDDQLEAYVHALPLQAGAIGLLAVMDGKVLGLDLVSLSSAYAKYHNQLIRSHAMEALRACASKADAEQSAPAVGSSTPMGCVLEFMEACGALHGQVHRVPGCGENHRFVSRAVEASALVFAGALIHLLAFPGEEAPQRSVAYQPRIHRRR